MRYCKTVSELIARWGLGLIKEKTGTEFLCATKTGLFTGDYRERNPSQKDAFAVWAPGRVGEVVLLKLEKTSYSTYHSHKNAAAWGLTKLGIQVSETPSFNIKRGIRILEASAKALANKAKCAKERKPLFVAEHDSILAAVQQLKAMDRSRKNLQDERRQQPA